VTVDGQVVRELGTKVDPRQATIAVDGQRVHLERSVYYAVNKPKGYVSTNEDPAGRPRVVDLLPEIPQRVYTVGRLDEMSTGLMLLTNDGELANKLAHPKYGVEKVYRAVVAGVPDREVLNKLTEGVWLAEGKVRAKHVRAVGRKGEATVLEMVLAEGKNREVRRMLAKFGHKVMSLTRVAVGPISLKGLAPGAFRPLSGHEVDLLRKVAAGIAVAPRFAERRPRPSGRARPSGDARGRERRPGGHQGHGGASHPPRRAPVSGAPSSGPRRPSRPGPASAGPRRGASGPRPVGPGAPPVRPEGPPPSRRKSTPPRPEPPTRRIIGLGAQAGPPPGRSRSRPVKARRRGPRAALGVRRPPAGEVENE
jgi:23S rRNA pseudouridine2605 synthase